MVVNAQGVRYYLHLAIDDHNLDSRHIIDAPAGSPVLSAQRYLLSILYPYATPAYHLIRRHCNHATISTAHLRTLPIGNTKIALSVGSWSPPSTVVLLVLALKVHVKRAFSTYNSAYNSAAYSTVAMST
jgi:hypothetical protein